MKRTYLPKRSLYSWLPQRASVMIIVASLLFVVLLRVLFPAMLWRLASPVWRVADMLDARIHSLALGVQERTSTARAYEQLRGEYEALYAEVLALRALRAEMEALPASGMVAQVLARPPQSPYDTLVIDRGSVGGVRVGMLTRGPGGVPVGTVRYVLERSAQVVLFSSPHVTTPVWVGETRVPLTLQGSGGGSLYADAPRAAIVQIGDPVYAVGGGLPPLGIVAHLEDDPSAPVVRVHVVPAINPFQLMRITLHDEVDPRLFEHATTSAVVL